MGRLCFKTKARTICGKELLYGFKGAFSKGTLTHFHRKEHFFLRQRIALWNIMWHLIPIFSAYCFPFCIHHTKPPTHKVILSEKRSNKTRREFRGPRFSGFFWAIAGGLQRKEKSKNRASSSRKIEIEPSGRLGTWIRTISERWKGQKTNSPWNTCLCLSCVLLFPKRDTGLIAT